MVDLTVKLPAVNCTPPTVTTTLPLVAVAGTGTTMSVGLQLQGVAVTPLNFTVPVVPRLLPVIATAAPTPPIWGDIPEMPAVAATVKKFIPLFDSPPTVTITFPLFAPVGTDILIWVAVHCVAAPATVPLNFTVLVPCGLPKLVPVMVTSVPTFPVFGERPVTPGTAPVTVKFM